MSYDIYLFRTPPGRDAQEVFDELMEREESGIGEPPEEPDADVARYSSNLEEALGDDGVCDASQSYVTINIPYHHEGPAAKRLFGKVIECLRQAHDEAGLSAFDPQLGREIDFAQDFGDILKINDRTMRVVGDMTPRKSGTDYKFEVEPTKKPWWRFWG